MESLSGGTTSRLVPAERSARRPGTSALELNGPITVVRHHGELCMLALSTAILNWIRSGNV